MRFSSAIKNPSVGIVGTKPLLLLPVIAAVFILFCSTTAHALSVLTGSINDLDVAEDIFISGNNGNFKVSSISSDNVDNVDNGDSLSPSRDDHMLIGRDAKQVSFALNPVEVIKSNFFAAARGGGVSPSDQSLKVPGNNPFFLCGDPKKFSVDIISVDLDPNPPQANHNLSIIVKANVRKQIEQKANVALSVKYGLVTLINQKFDLCSQLPHIGMTCPIKPGYLEIKRQVKIPNELPKGVFTVTGEAYHHDGSEITCLTATVELK